MNIPTYIKKLDNEPWPEDKLFYWLTSDGLFICRNHAWFKSCSPAKTGPPGLGSQKSFVELGYPLIPKSLMQKAMKFFRHIHKAHHWESALILVCDRNTQQVDLLCPEQKASWSDVEYEIPAVPFNLAVIGDIHSHGNMSPNPSITDEKDELKRPGLHFIAGRIDDPKPDIACEAVVDGQRFSVKDLSIVMEPYEDADTGPVPKEWLDKVKEKKWKVYEGTYHGTYQGGLGYSYGGGMTDFVSKPDKCDLIIIDRILDNYDALDVCPEMTAVRQSLFRSTKEASYLYCEKRAQKYVKHWKRRKAHYEKSHAQK